MGRVEKRMYRQRRGQALLRRGMVFLTAVVVLVGLASRLTGGDGMTARRVSEPTATPVASAFDETVVSREVALRGDTWYAIQTGIFAGREAAEEKAALYADRGAPGYVTQDGQKWRVFIACYGDKDDATAVRDRLAEQQMVETYLYGWDCPAITLRLSGMAGQLDVAEAGLTGPMQTAALLRDSAAQLDAGEIMINEAVATVDALTAQLALWEKTAQERFAPPYPALIAQELAVHQAWAEGASALRAAAGQDATALSAEMKRQAMTLYEESIRLRAAIDES